jgi:hypothetical protein
LSINRGPASTDQRGLARPFTADQQCDAGAYELQPGNDLALTMSGFPASVQLGSPATFTITVAATGPSGDATQPTVTAPTPSGASLVSITPSQGSCSGITCSLGSLANGSTATVTLVVMPSDTGTLAASSSVSGPRPETSSANNTADAAVSVKPIIAQTPETQTPTPTGAVKLKKLRFKPSHFRAAKGSKLSFNLSAAGKVTFKVERKRCVHKKHCKWHKLGRSFKRNGKAGANSFHFVRRSLAPGGYRLTATPAGKGAKALHVKFTIVP